MHRMMMHICLQKLLLGNICGDLRCESYNLCQCHYCTKYFPVILNLPVILCFISYYYAQSLLLDLVCLEALVGQLQYGVFCSIPSGSLVCWSQHFLHYLLSWPWCYCSEPHGTMKNYHVTEKIKIQHSTAHFIAFHLMYSCSNNTLQYHF